MHGYVVYPLDYSKWMHNLIWYEKPISLIPDKNYICIRSYMYTSSNLSSVSLEFRVIILITKNFLKSALSLIKYSQVKTWSNKGWYCIGDLLTNIDLTWNLEKVFYIVNKGY